MKSFEENLKRLEELAEKLKSGEIPIEEAMAIFEEGISIAKKLEKELSKYERKIEILINNPEKEKEEPKFELFPELSESGEETNNS